MPADSVDDITSVAALGEPVRRALYRHIATQADGVSRDEAARAVKIARPLAAYHLDRLAELGLLDVEYRRPPGRGGPGAGRPAKLYRRSTRPVRVSLPPRNYELASRLLVEAIDAAGSLEPHRALLEAAREFGVRLGAKPHAGSRSRLSRRRRLEDLEANLEASGFEPTREGRTILLRNCPFRALAETHQDLVCGMNLALMEGVIKGSGIDGLSATLDMSPGRCCVVLKTAARRSAARVRT